jgi:hypothetical protein
VDQKIGGNDLNAWISAKLSILCCNCNKQRAIFAFLSVFTAPLLSRGSLFAKVGHSGLFPRVQALARKESQRKIPKMGVFHSDGLGPVFASARSPQPPYVVCFVGLQSSLWFSKKVFASTFAMSAIRRSVIRLAERADIHPALKKVCIHFD